MRWLLLTLLWAASVAAVEPPRLTLVSDVYCPFTCDPATGVEGYMVALTRGLLGAEKLSIEYVLTPWSRALQQMQAGQIDGIVGVSQARAGDWLLSPPLGYDGVTFFSLKPVLPPRLEPGNLRWLDGLRLGHVASPDLGDGPFDRYVKARQLNESFTLVSLSGVNPVTSLLRMLHAGRIDVLAENAQVVRFTYNKIGLQGELFSLGTLQARSLHLALAPSDENRALMAIFMTQLARWRSDGRLAALMAQYGLSDWQVERVPTEPKPAPAAK